MHYNRIAQALLVAALVIGCTSVGIANTANTEVRIGKHNFTARPSNGRFWGTFPLPDHSAVHCAGSEKCLFPKSDPWANSNFPEWMSHIK